MSNASCAVKLIRTPGSCITTESSSTAPTASRAGSGHARESSPSSAGKAISATAGMTVARKRGPHDRPPAQSDHALYSSNRESTVPSASRKSGSRLPRRQKKALAMASQVSGTCHSTPLPELNSSPRSPVMSGVLKPSR